MNDAIKNLMGWANDMDGILIKDLLSDIREVCDLAERVEANTKPEPVFREIPLAPGDNRKLYTAKPAPAEIEDRDPEDDGGRAGDPGEWEYEHSPSPAAKHSAGAGEYDPPCPDMDLDEQVRHARGFANGVCRKDHHVARLLEQMARSIEGLRKNVADSIPLATVLAEIDAVYAGKDWPSTNREASEWAYGKKLLASLRDRFAPPLRKLHQCEGVRVVVQHPSDVNKPPCPAERYDNGYVIHCEGNMIYWLFRPSEKWSVRELTPDEIAAAGIDASEWLGGAK